VVKLALGKGGGGQRQRGPVLWHDPVEKAAKAAELHGAFLIGRGPGLALVVAWGKSGSGGRMGLRRGPGWGTEGAKLRLPMSDGTDKGGVAIWLLALGQTLIYAGSYYSFPALLPDLEAATGWSKATLALGPTLAFLIMVSLTVITGRLVDRGLGASPVRVAAWGCGADLAGALEGRN
jgi:VIT1/CCC1 family predicted Fe2+/Mn2+ transporter